MPLPRLALALPLLAFTLGAAAPANAATVGQWTADTIRFAADPGHDDQLTVTDVDGAPTPTVRITDAAPGVTVTSSDSCTTIVGAPVATVECTVSPTATVMVDSYDGADTITSQSTHPVRFNGGDGSDVLTAGAAQASLDGEAGADHLVGGPNRDTLRADCGDVASGAGGADYIGLAGGATADGGPGDDHFIVETPTCPDGNDVHGGDGTDELDAWTAWASSVAAVVSLDDVADDGPIGGASWNVHSDVEALVGGDEPDLFSAGPGAQTLNGAGGPDALDGGPGDDALVGGGDEDAVDYESRTAGVTVDLATSGGEAGEHDTYSGIEDAWGGSGADVLHGDAQDNVLDGGAGPDQLTGGAGDDLVDYSLRDAPVTADLAGGAANDGEAGEHDTIAADVEGLIGGDGADTLTGGPGDGGLYGGGGADHLVDTGGVDDLDGGAGADVIAARDKATDAIDCGADADQVTADVADTVTGCESVARTDPVPPPVVAPDTIVLTQPKGVFVGAGPLSYTFTSNVPGATFRCTVDGAKSVCASPLVLHDLSAGRHVITIAAVGPTGAFDVTPETEELQVDRTAPAVSVTVPKPGCVAAKGTSVRVRGTDPAAIGRLAVTLGGRTVADQAGGVVRVRVTAKQVRSSRLRVTAVDTAGNATTRSFRLKACPKPRPRS